MEKEINKVSANKVSKYQFTLDDIRKMVENPELLNIIESLSKEEYNKGKNGQHLLSIARAVYLIPKNE